MRANIQWKFDKHVDRASQLTKKTNQFNLTQVSIEKEDVKSYEANDNKWIVIVMGSSTVSTSLAPTQPSKRVRKNANVIGANTFFDFLKCMYPRMNVIKMIKPTKAPNNLLRYSTHASTRLNFSGSM